jgi:hypothetical protein
VSATKTSQAKANDWSLAPRGVVSGTVMSAAGIVLAAGVGDIAHVPPVFAGAGTVVGALAHLATSTHRAKHTPGAILCRLGYWACGGGWLTWALTGPANWHHAGGLAALAVGALGAGITAEIASATRAEQAAARAGGPGTDVVLAGGGTTGREWAERIRRVCRVSVQVTAVTDYPTGTGHYVHVLLPIGGKTIDDIARHAKALATDARLPKGCRVDVEEGDRQGEVIISVPTVNRLTEEIPYTVDAVVRSILDLVPLGEFQDGSIVGVPLRQLCVLAVGMAGSGKTTLLDLFTDGIGRCVDALVWHIDLNGGGMTWSWLQPWINGEVDRPAVDWAAKTEDEALLMVQIAYAIGLSRKGSHNHLKHKLNTRLMPISADLPEIVIVVDEGKTLLANTATGTAGRIRELLIKISDELRDAGIRLVVSGLRATADTIDTAFKVQSGVKIGMRVDKDSELAHLFDWDKGLKCADLPAMGCGYVQYDQQAPRMFKTRHILPGHIIESAHTIADTRPDLDEAGRKVAGQVYETRYDRMRKAFSGGPDHSNTELVPAGVGAGAAVTTPAAPTTPTRPGRPHLTLMNGGANPADWPHPRDIAHATTAAPSTPLQPADWPEPAQLAAQLTGRRPGAAGALTPGTTPAPAAGPVRPVPELVRRALDAFDAAGDDRMHSEALAQALGIGSAHDMAEMLGLLGIKSLSRAFVRSGKERRGYAREDFVQAAERIASGELAVPAKVAAWTAA